MSGSAKRKRRQMRLEEAKHLELLHGFGEALTDEEIIKCVTYRLRSVILEMGQATALQKLAKHYGHNLAMKYVSNIMCLGSQNDNYISSYSGVRIALGYEWPWTYRRISKQGMVSLDAY